MPWKHKKNYVYREQSHLHPPHRNNPSVSPPPHPFQVVHLETTIFLKIPKKLLYSKTGHLFKPQLTGQPIKNTFLFSLISMGTLLNTQTLQNMVQLCVWHFSIPGFIVEFQDFCEIFNVSNVLVFFGGGENWEEVVDLN